METESEQAVNHQNHSGIPGSEIRGVPEAIVSSGISLRLWRLYAQAWLVCLLFPILFLVQTPLAPVRLIVAIAGLAAFVVTYTWLMWPHPLNNSAHTRTVPRTSPILFVALMAQVLLLSLAYGNAFLWLFVGVSAVAGVVLPARMAFVIVMGLTLITLGLGVGMSGGLAQTDWLHLVPLVLLVRGLGLDMTGVIRLADTLRDLHVARGELARRAVTEERLRLARDLHDLLGHTLSLITLKSELAGRLIEKEPAQAAHEIREVERVARQALREVREAVVGYRQPTLRGELDSARQMLEAAGIVCTVENTAGALPPVTDAVLAWTVREGVTNVIRHSRARHCTIRVSHQNDRACVEILNDNYRAEAAGQAKTGSGLTGLRERIVVHAGQMESGPLLTPGNPSFRLWVELPTPSRSGIEQERLR